MSARPARAANPAYYDYLRGMVEERAGNLNKALGAYEKAVAKDPDALEVYRDIAQVNLRLGKTDAALEAARKICELAPKDPSSHIFLGNVYIAQGQMDEAAKAYEQALELDPGNLRALENLGNYYALTDAAKAISYYARYLKLEPRDGEMQFQMGMVQHKAGRLKEAIASFRKALKVDPGQVAPHLALAEIYEAEKSTSAAIAEFEKAAQLQPGHPLIHSRLGQLYQSQGDAENAARHFRIALEAQPNDPTAHYWLARIAEENQDWGVAADHAQKAYETTEDPQFLPLLAYYLTLDHRPAEAVKWLEKARGGKAANANVLLFLGINYLELEKTDKAVEALREGVRLTPKDPQMRFQLGVALDRAGKFEEAIPEFEAVLREDPKNAAAMNYLGYTWADRGERLEESEKLLRKAVAMEPENGAYLDSLGWVRFKRGDYGEAVSYLEKAAARNADPLIFDHLGEAQLAAGRVSKSVEAWKKSLELDPRSESVANKLATLSTRLAVTSDPRKLLKTVEGNFRQIGRLSAPVSIDGRLRRSRVKAAGRLRYVSPDSVEFRIPSGPDTPDWKIKVQGEKVTIAPREFAGGAAPQTLESLKALPKFFSGDLVAAMDGPEVETEADKNLIRYSGKAGQMWIDPARPVMTRLIRPNAEGGQDELTIESYRQVEGLWLPAALRLRNRAKKLDARVTFSEWEIGGPPAAAGEHPGGVER